MNFKLYVNDIANEISRICREIPLKEKKIIAPSLRIGYQWLDSITRSGRNLINIRVETFKGLVLELAAQHMVEKGLRPLSEKGAEVLIGRIWHKLKSRNLSYLSALPVTRSLLRTIFTSINAVRLAGLEASDLKPGLFEVLAKGEEMALVLCAWVDELKELGLADYAMQLSLAVKRIEEDHRALEGYILIPEDFDGNTLEKRLLEALPPSRLVRLNTENDGGSAELSAPDNSSVFRAVGEVNEVREVLRRCLAQEISLDEVEILHTDTDTYIPLIYELMHGAEIVAKSDFEQPPVTFSEGLPILYSRPGRALLAWLEWKAGGFRQSVAVRMIADGLLSIDGIKDSGFSFVSLASLLRSVPVGFGRERYLTAIENCCIRLRDRTENPRDEESSEIINDSVEMASRRLRGLEILKNVIRKLLKNIPSQDISSKGQLDSALVFLDTMARSASMIDNYAREALIKELREMKCWVGEETSDLTINIQEWLHDLPHDIKVGGSGPRPGCIHVSHFLNGGHSGRPYTFIIGMDENRFPGAGLQDPLLLDRERRKLSPDLRTEADNLHHRITGFKKLLARITRIKGSLTIGFFCRDLLQEREIFPSLVLLDVCRNIFEKKTGDLKDLNELLGPPASFAPDRTEYVSNEAEWWMWRFAGNEDRCSPVDLISERYPHLARGYFARKRRQETVFSSYDGFVPEAGWSNDPSKKGGPVLSSSRLEYLGRCPLGYFFRYVLGIAQPEEILPDPDQWLDPLRYGSLMHEIFHVFMTELAKDGLLPSASRDRQKMDDIIDCLTARYRKRYPPVSESAYRRQYLRLVKTSRIFLNVEEAFYKTHRPLFLEASIGMPSSVVPTAFDVPEPMKMILPDGRMVYVRGRVDRVDRALPGGKNSFSITDYKSGGSFKFTRPDPFWQGRVIQHALYMSIVEKRLKEKVSSDAEIDSFRYFFPDYGQRGEEVIFKSDDLKKYERVIAGLTSMLAGGIFPPTDNPQDDGCRFCDYSSICGSPEEIVRNMKIKMENIGNRPLDSYRELRNMSDDD